MVLSLPEHLWKHVLAFFVRCPICDERMALLVRCGSGFVFLCPECFGVYEESVDWWSARNHVPMGAPCPYGGPHVPMGALMFLWGPIMVNGLMVNDYPQNTKNTKTLIKKQKNKNNPYEESRRARPKLCSTWQPVPRRLATSLQRRAPSSGVSRTAIEASSICTWFCIDCCSWCAVAALMN